MTELLAHRYRVLRSLGQGGMGQVWLVEDQLGGTPVALKVITGEAAATPAARLQLRQEFRLMTRIRHPNSCAVYDYGELADGAPYFTMEVVPGHGLDELKPMSAERFGAIAAQLLLALGDLHQRGFVHGDLKSENVRVTPDGVVKLMDFGLMELAGRSGLPIRGTLGYVAPEVIKRGPIDARTDLYAFGALALELLSGHLPFERPTAMATLQAHLNEAPPLVGLDPAWAGVIRRLLAKEPIERFSSAYEVLAALGFEVPPGLGGRLLSSPLVGREQELARLEAGLAAVREGRPGGSLGLPGPAGAGKTRLLGELRIQSQLAGVPCALGAASEAGGTPYQPFVAALRALLPEARAAVPEAIAVLAPVLVHLLPELGVAPAPKLDTPDKEKLRLFGAVHGLVSALAAAKGAVLLLENWQWADGLSRELLGYLLRNGQACPWLIVVAGRAIDGAELAETLPLGPLGPEPAHQMLATMLGTPRVPESFAATLLAFSEGSPLILEIALQHLVETLVLQRGPAGWNFDCVIAPEHLPINHLGLLMRKLSFLAEPVLAVARVFALLAHPAELALIGALVDQPEEALFDAVALLENEQLIRRDEAGRYTLAQASLAPLLEEPLPEAERRHLHGAAAAWWLARLGATPLVAWPIEALAPLAHHALRGPDRALAARAALEAGKRLTLLFANAEAERLLVAGLVMAREAGDRAQVLDYLRFLADIERVTGRYEEAIARYEEACALAEALGEPLILGRVLTSLAKAFQMRDRLDEALAACRRTLQAIAPLGAGPVSVRACLTEARVLFYMGRTAEALAQAEAALATARALNQPGLVAQALSLLGYLVVAATPEACQEGIRRLEESIALFEGLQDRLGLYNAFNLLGNARMAQGDYRRAWADFDRSRALSYELGSRDDETFAWLNLAIARLEMGGFAEARQAASEASRLAEATRSRFTAALARAVDATAGAYAGEAAPARERLEAALEEARAIKSKYLEALVLPYAIEVALHVGALEAAGRALEALTALIAETGNTEPEGRALALAAEWRTRRGEWELGRAQARSARDRAQADQARGNEARALKALARACLEGKEVAAAREAAQAALAAAEASGAEAQAAEIWGLLGACDLAEGQSAVAAFARMRSLAQPLGAPWLEAEACFGAAAATPYGAEAAALVREAQALMTRAGEGCAGFGAYPERARVIEGNHHAFSLPSVDRRAGSGPLGPLGGMRWGM